MVQLKSKQSAVLSSFLEDFVVRFGGRSFFLSAAFAVLLIVLTISILLIYAFKFTGSGRQSATNMVAESVAGEPLELFVQRPIGNSFLIPPRISQVVIVDLDRDGLQDVVVCDCVENTVSWIRQVVRGEFTEYVIADNLIAPARVDCVDFDGDNDIDIFVAVLGQLFPTNEHIGSLVALENVGNERFERHILLKDVARVSDVRSADMDGDDDLDLVVTQFGYDDGETRWLENIGSWQFESHILQSYPGGIHGIPADMNGDKKMDIVTLISQNFEKTTLLLGTGNGKFVESEIYRNSNLDFGSAGIWIYDLDQDGDLDVLYCNGDAMDYSPPRPWPWHGVQWLENLNGYNFKFHRLADFGGAVNAQVVDYDFDGDLDIFVSSAFNDWSEPTSQSLILLENVGNMRFTVHSLGNAPTHIQALAVGDLDGDGRLDIVTGGMHVAEPYDRVARIVFWQGGPNMPIAPKL